MTTTEIATICPHCSASNPPGGAFCESCGHALPSAMQAGPRIVSDQANPTSTAATKLVGDQLVKQTKSAANTLLIVSIIQFVIGGVLLAVLSLASQRSANQPRALIVALSMLIIGCIFLSLYFWAAAHHRCPRRLLAW